MKAVAAARQWWAARRPALQIVAQRDRPGLGAAPPGTNIARGAAISLVLLAAALIACAVIGFAVTQQNDRRLLVEQHAALQTALAELRAVIGDLRHVEGGQLQFIARRSGLKHLRFGADPAQNRAREIQSLQDGRGRIVGWFSWTPDRALIRAMYWLWALAGAAGIALSGGAFVAARAIRRLTHCLASSLETTRKIEQEQADHRLLLRELESAIAAQAFDVHYQPIVAAAGGAIVGVEALMRWTHPTRGAIAPSTFVPIAEQHGLMQELGDIVLHRALADATRWPDLFVAINLSPVQIRDPHFVERVAAIVGQAGIAPPRVVLEMTEGILIDDPHEIQVRLEALRALGVTLALDDFGTGYSSLSYLQKFPFNRLKIDRAFVAALGTIGNAGAIIHSIVTLGHALGMTVLAEGVETDQQRVLLRLAGCDEMQGFLFAKPCPAEAIDAIVLRSASGRGANEQPAAIAS